MVKEIIHDWRTDLIVGSVAAAVSFVGGLFEFFPGWITAGQGIVGGAFLTLGAIGLTGANAQYLMEVYSDEDV